MGQDLWGRDASTLKEKRLFLFDMDGTVYTGETPFDGALDLIKQIAQNGGIYVFITNNSSKSVTDYVTKVSAMGIACNEKNFFTSAQATILYLYRHCIGKSVYCMGTRSFVRELRENGITVNTDLTVPSDVVVVGYDTELNYQKLQDVCTLLQNEIPYIATNSDWACPVNGGFVPDCGAICEMIWRATGKKPVFIGKPNADMIDMAREANGCQKSETVMIGDRLYTDIAAGNNAGVDTVCVLTGEATRQDTSSGINQPTFVFCSVRDIWEELKTESGESCSGSK